MSRLHLFRKKLHSPLPDATPAPFELELRLDEQLRKGDLSGVTATLSRIGRRLFHGERMDLIRTCMENGNYAEALYLTGGLPPSPVKKCFLEDIARGAALAGYYGIARAAALLCEQTKT